MGGLRKTPQEKEQSYIENQKKYIKRQGTDLSVLEEDKAELIEEARNAQQIKNKWIQFHQEQIQNLETEFEEQRKKYKARQEKLDNRIKDKQREIKEANDLLADKKERAANK